MPSNVVLRSTLPNPPLSQLLFLVLPRFADGTFRVVRAADTAVVAHVSTVAVAPTSAASRQALLIYHAALDDLDTPAVDIKFLRGVFEAERQADVDRADPVAYAAATGTPYHDFSDED